MGCNLSGNCSQTKRECRGFRGAIIRDWPDKPYRGISLYLPGRDNIPFFKRFVSDFIAMYKYNTLIMEMNACMRLESHPELNYGWVQFARDVNYSCRNYPLRTDPRDGTELLTSGLC